MTIDVIIPLYKPGQELFQLLDALGTQTRPVNQIILMNTEKAYLERLVSEEALCQKYPKVKVFHVTKQEFDHGGTRRLGVEHSSSDIFVMMTQDALPGDNKLLEQLTGSLEGQIAAAYARQLPKEDCNKEECYARTFNYPDQSRVKTKADMEELGIKTFFCSNVCAAYRRDIYEKLGGFVNRAIFNEDMIYASAVIRAGYGISYEASARVYHSHNYTNMQQFHRNFDLGVSQADYPQVFSDVPSESEGKKLVLRTTHYLKEQHLLYRIPHFYLNCACKYAGYWLGKHYKKLPQSLVLRFTSNREYWKKIFTSV